MGNLACSTKVFARPSQSCAICKPAFQVLSALRVPAFPFAPIETTKLSTPAAPPIILWQLLHDWALLIDKAVSKYSFLPK
jgi:hypothetical protein